jgi:hypothetical protein
VASFLNERGVNFRKSLEISVRAGCGCFGSTWVLAKEMSKSGRITIGQSADFSDNVAGSVEFRIGFSEGADGAFGAGFAGAEGDEENLVFAVVDEFLEFGFHADAFDRGEVALEDGKLQVIAEIFAGFENAAQAFRIRDVVGDDIGRAHGGYRVRKGM